MTLITRLIPAADRDAIVGDLLEEAAWRDMHGTRLSWWIAGQCATIAAGLTVERARAACSLALAREVASGVAVGGGRLLRGTPPRAFATRALLFVAGVAALALSAEVLVGALLRSAGL